jgi:hypothetical protein
MHKNCLSAWCVKVANLVYRYVDVFKESFKLEFILIEYIRSKIAHLFVYLNFIKTWRYLGGYWVSTHIYTGVLISLQPDQEGKKLHRQKILMFICPIYNHYWRHVSTIYIYIYITRLASNEIFSPSNKIHREVGRAKDLPAPRYFLFLFSFRCGCVIASYLSIWLFVYSCRFRNCS